MTGGGTPGRISKWSGVSGSSTYVLGDSNIYEDKFGKVGIGTTTPTSLLTVQGMIETTLGGLKFPDGTIQTTALSASDVVHTLNGLNGDVTLAATSPITITPSGNTLTIAAPNALTAVAHDTTLQGNGTAGSPLSVSVPLVLSGAVNSPGPPIPNSVIQVTNTANAGKGFVANAGPGGAGVEAHGGGSFLGLAGFGVHAFGGDGGSSNGGAGVRAFGGDSSGSQGGVGIEAEGGSGGNGGTRGLAGKFDGDVEILGKLKVDSGIKMFHIDHPLDPENKYLNHAAIESAEVLNIYSGNITTDANGDGVVDLPEWFEALNKDHRYQLTVIGTFAQAIIAKRIKDNRFTIKTNGPNVEVSWQVTGVRSDPTTHKYKFDVEEEKGEGERGYYLNADAYGQPEEKSIRWARDPERMRQLKQRRLKAEEMRKQRQLDR